jgi:spoIIIJ-associated protein
MNPAETAREILDTMLGHLGFPAQIELEESPAGPTLQVSLEQAEALIGAKAERLEDLQYLVNRLLQAKLPDAPKIRVDVGHVREMHEDELMEAVRQAADRVRATKMPVHLSPLNSFHRRLVHNHFLEDPDIKSSSPPEKRRYKRITLQLRN